MGRLWDSVFLVGLALMALVCVAMFTVETSITTNDVFNVSRSVSGAVSPKIAVSLKVSLNAQDNLNHFPKVIGGWESVKDYADTSLETRLMADAYILRDYQGTQQPTPPFFLLLLHSKLANSFHDPKVCYKGEGYTIGPFKQESIAVQGIQGITNIPVNRLEIYRVNSKGTITERMLVLYTYFRDAKLTSSEITILRVSTPVDRFDNAASEQSLKEFMSRNFDEVVRSFAGDGKLITYIARTGYWGYLVIILAFIIPLAMILYPLITRKLFRQIKMNLPPNR